MAVLSFFFFACAENTPLPPVNPSQVAVTCDRSTRANRLIRPVMGAFNRGLWQCADWLVGRCGNTLKRGAIVSYPFFFFLFFLGLFSGGRERER